MTEPKARLYNITMRLLSDAGDVEPTFLKFSLAAANILDAESKARDNAHLLGYPSFGWHFIYAVSDHPYKI